MSMVQAAVTKTLNQKNDQQPLEKPKVSLKSIIYHAKNNGSSCLHPVISTLTTTEEGDCKSKLDKIKNSKIYSTIMEGTEIIQDVNES